MSDNSEKRVLILDDMESMRMSLKANLKKLGFEEFEEAENGNIGIDRLLSSVNENKPISLIFSDINMPELTGLEFVRAIREKKAFSTIPIIMVSTENEREIVLDAIISGANDYIIKPFSSQTIAQKVSKVLSEN